MNLLFLNGQVGEVINQIRSPMRSGRKRSRPPTDSETLGQSRGRQTWAVILDWLAVIVPPTTLVASLAFWFGYTYTSARTFYLGIDVSVLKLSTTDYLVRSAEPIIVPAAVVMSILLAGIGVHALIDLFMRSRPGNKIIKASGLAFCIIGGMMLLLGIRTMFVLTPGIHYLIPPTLLGGGAVFTAYGFYIWRKVDRRSDLTAMRQATPVWEKGGYVVIVLLLILSLFWAATLYAGALGRGRAQATEQHLTTSPSVVVYSQQSLALAPPVLETKITAPHSKYRFRYSGLRFLLHSAGRYFLLPEGWTRSNGSIIVIEDDQTIRVEFKVGKP